MDGHHVHPSNLMVSYGFDPSQIKLKMKQCSAAVLGDHQLKKISLMLSTNLIYQMPKNPLNIIVFTSVRQFWRVFDQQQVVFHGGKAGNSILIMVNITELISYNCQHRLSSTSIVNWLRWNMMNHYHDWWNTITIHHPRSSIIKSFWWNMMKFCHNSWNTIINYH